MLNDNPLIQIPERLVEAPRIDVKLMPGQLDFLHVPNSDLVTMDWSIYQGGVGSGKTYVGCNLGLLLCSINFGLRLLCMAKTFPLLRDTTMVTYFELLDQYGFIDGVHYKWLKGDAILTFPIWNNSAIYFRHLENPEKIKSFNAGAIQIEEISQITEADFRMAMSRLRQKGIKRYRGFGHTNPEPAKGWIYKYFVEENKGLTEVEVENADGEKEKAVIQFRRIISPTTDNKHLPPHYVESLRQTYDEDYYNIYVLGRDGDYRRGLVMAKFSEANKDRALEFNPLWPVYITCDFNIDPMCWIFAHRVDGRFLYFDELAVEGGDIEDCVMEFLGRYGDEIEKSGQPLFVTGDASGNNRDHRANRKIGLTSYAQMMTYLRREGMQRAQLDVPTANPAVRDRIDIFNGAICNANGERKVIINPDKCPRLMQNVDNLKFIPGTSIIQLPTPTEIARDSSLKFIGHPYDAASYLVCRYTPKVVDKGGHYGHVRTRTYRT